MPRRPRRYIISSDQNPFIGRMYELSIVGMYFDTYDEAVKYPDAKYVLDVNERASLLARRIESLNHVGDLLWQKPPIRVEALPISAFDFCNLIQDAFLMRTISILDCCCLLAVEVLELDVKPRQTNIDRIRKLSSNHACCAKLDAISKLQMDLRTERNVRFHRAEEEPLTDDDTTFQVMARYKHWGRDMGGFDRYGRKVNLSRSYNQAIDSLRLKFRIHLKALNSSLSNLYESLFDEFEMRFKRKFRDETSFGRIHGVRGRD